MEKVPEEVHWSYRSMRRFEMMLAAVGLIFIVAADLWAHTVSLVLITAVVERTIRPDQDTIEALARTVVIGCGKIQALLKVGHESEKASSSGEAVAAAIGVFVRAGCEKINAFLKKIGGEPEVACSIGGAIGGAVGGAIGGAVRIYLRVRDKSFEPVGVALGIVLGRTFGKAFTTTILNRNKKKDSEGIQGQLGGALGGGTGVYFCSIIGEIIGRNEIQFCSMIGGILGGLLGCVIGALRVNWLLERFISPFAALFIGVIAALCGIIGLHGSMVLAMLMMRPLLNKLVEQTSTNEDQNKEKADSQKNSWTELDKDIPRRAMECCRSMLAAGGLVSTVATGNAAPYILGSLAGIAALPELLNCGGSKDMLGVASSAKHIWKIVVAKFEKWSGYLVEIVETSLKEMECAEIAGIIAGIISGAVGGSVGGATNALIKIIHPVFGQTVGAALGAIVGWTIGKAFTTDNLKRPTQKWSSGAVGGALGGNIGAFFGFVTGGVVGGLIGGMIGVVCDIDILSTGETADGQTKN